MSKNKEYELAIKIAGEIEKSFYDSTKLTKKELEAMAKQAAKSAMAASEAYQTTVSIPQKLQSGLKDAEPFFSGMEHMASASFKAIVAAATGAGASIAAGLGASTSVGSEFESAFAGVKKTVDATDEELAQMRDEIRQMAKEMPSTASELSEIAEAAGQLGIQTENITEFTKTMADMAVATNLTSDEAASNFAQFANITEMPQDRFDELGSTVVALGNTMATTESDIVSMGMRLAAAGNQVGLAQNQIMGYAASLSSVGIEAEAGGSAFSKLLVNLQLATETGKNLSDYAKVAGMTGQQFKQAFKEDATTAINAFLAGLNDTERNGKSAIAVLTDMGIKEVRLRDTLLRAANASDLFESALETANTAWDENVALANEAAQRYATFESQCTIVKNKISDIGISVYDDLKPGLTDAMMLSNEFVDSLAGQEDVVGNVIDSVVKKMPTMVRQVKEAGNAVGDFAEPFLRVGGWLVDNPGLITGTIAGIGTSLATYKVATGVMSLASALGSLGPVGMTILGIGGVAAVITGIGTAVKKSAAEAKKANLDKHFGNISLSMQELQETASFIVKSKSLDQIRESITAMGELDGIAEQISDAANEIDKANWKISIGMDLTGDEMQDYQNQIQTYVKSTQEYLTQRQYGVTLSIKTLLGDDLEDSNVINQVNAFYAGKQQELSDLGTQLNETITEAFNDGLLDMDEVAEIAKLQEQMAHIQSALAGSDFEASLDLIGMKYSGQPLDADTFQNLQAEIQSQMQEAVAAYDEAYKTSMSEYRLMLSEGAWSQEEFAAASEELNRGYLQQKAGLQEKGAQFQLDTIRQAYGEELDALINQLQEETGTQLSEMLNNVAYGGEANIHLDWLGENIVDSLDIDKSTKDALADLFEQMKPAMEEMQELAQQCRDAGISVPESISQGLVDMGAIGALAGDTEAVWSVIGKTVESEEYQQAIEDIEKAGGYIPEGIANAIVEGQDQIDEAVRQSYFSTQGMINRMYGANSLNIPVNFTANAPYSEEYLENNLRTGHADGGIFTKPHVAWFAEDGPEAAIPLDGSRNAIDLWLKTGELLKMDGITGGPQPLSEGIETAAQSYNSQQSIQIDYNPTLQFYGDSPSRQDVEDALETDREKFARQMEQWIKDNARFKFQ